MSERILGIDLGSYSVKIAEIERDFRSFQLVGFYEQPLVSYSSGSMSSAELLTKEASWAQALMKLFDEYNLPKNYIYTALPGQFSAIRLMTLPFRDFKKIDQTIEFEMENYIPLPLEEMLLDYQIIPPSVMADGKISKEEISNILACYARKSELIDFLNIFQGADMDPRFVGCEPIEMANIMKLGILQPEGAYAILDMGHDKTNVLIFQGPHLQYARTIWVGGRHLTLAISESMKIPYNEAEVMKVEMGQVGPEVEGADATTRGVSEAIKTGLEDLLLQLKQTFMAYQERKSEVVQALILCGGTSRLQGIDQYVSTKMRKNVSFLDCLDFPFNRLADSNWCRSIAAPALSQAYRGVLGVTLREIQFRRGEFAYQGEIKEISRFAKESAVWMGVVILVAGISFLTSYVSLKGRVKNQTGQIEAIATQALPDVPKKSLSSPTSVLAMVSGRINEAEEKRKKIEDEIEFSVLNVLREFSTTLPPRESFQVDVDDFSYAAKRVHIQGKTTSFEAVDKIKTALSQAKLFKNVATENVRKGAADEVRFSLSFELQDPNAGEGRLGS